MRIRPVMWFFWMLLLSAAAFLAACGGGGGSTSASSSVVTASGYTEGASPFINFVQLSVSNPSQLSSIRYTIAAKENTVSKPVQVEYSLNALINRGYATSGSGSITLPVFGLYAGYDNQVTATLTYSDGSTKNVPLTVTTSAYTDANSIYDHVSVLTKRAAGSSLGYDFVFLKSTLGTPVVIDTDGEVRWVAKGVDNGMSSIFYDNSFIIGAQQTSTIQRLELDGTITTSALNSSVYTNFFHNIDPGKQGLLADLDGTLNGVAMTESSIVEITPTGDIIKDWPFATIIANYMTSQGDDPSTFVRSDADWFHSNAAVYDPSDDTVIVSSRENFLIKVDYQTGDIVWIFGDPTKYWYTFPSLRAKALTLTGGGLYPIGQHAPSITSDGLLMIFNNGAPSLNQPDGAAVGETLTYSAVSTYAIDKSAGTATEKWRFDYGQSIKSAYCSSSYEASDKSLLVDYAIVNKTDSSSARIVGLSADHSVVFDFEYPNSGCQTSWNAKPIAFDNLVFTK